MDWTPVYVALVPGVLSLLAVVLQARRDRAKARADAADVVTNAAQKAVLLLDAQLQRRIDDLEKCASRLAEVENRLLALESTSAAQTKTINRLRDQLRSLGHTPANGDS